MCYFPFNFIIQTSSRPALLDYKLQYCRSCLQKQSEVQPFKRALDDFSPGFNKLTVDTVMFGSAVGMTMGIATGKIDGFISC